MKIIDIKEVAKRDWFDYRDIFPFIVQIGVGGTGGYLVQHISQLLGTSKTRAAYVIADCDVIEEKNLRNQLFLPSEVGLKKADVLANRYSHAYGIDIGVYSKSYVETPEKLQSLFSREYMSTGITYSTLLLPIIIGTVDNHYTRRVINSLFNNLNTCIYIDAGNESTKVPSDFLTRSKENWRKEEIEAYKESGWSGQVVTGVRTNFFKQPSVVEMFPDILDDDELRPSEISCSELSASEPQRLMVNKFAALCVANILTEIIEEHTLSSHITFFHAKKGYMRTTPIYEGNEKEPYIA